MAITPTMGTPADNELKLVRRYDAPRPKVFDAWRTAERMRDWFMPRDFSVVDVDIDFQSNGEWSATIRGPGGTDYSMRGKYKDIVDGERIVFSHAWNESDGVEGTESTVTVTFSDDAGGCEIVFHQAPFETVERRDSHADGWDGVLEKLAEYLAN